MPKPSRLKQHRLDYGRWDLLLYLFPFLAIGALWAIALIRKIRREPHV